MRAEAVAITTAAMTRVNEGNDEPKNHDERLFRMCSCATDARCRIDPLL
jgi:hypothetical protein